MQLTQKERQAFSLANLMRSVTSNITRGTFELEVLHDFELRAGRNFDTNHLRLPWELLSTRDMSVAGVSGSQYLVGNQSLAPADILRPWSVTLRSGLTVIDGLRSNVSIPRVTTAATPQWLADELDPLVASQPTIGDVSLTPKICGALTTFSKQLQAQQDQVEAFVRAHLLATIGRAVDLALLGGSGLSGEPQGITATSGVGTGTVDAADPYAPVTALIRTVADNGSEPTAAISTPAIRELLQNRTRFTSTDTPVWDSGAGLAGVPAFATAACPASKLIIGDFSQAVLGLWGDGPEIALDAYTGWATGKLTMRVLLSMDTALLHPAAFAVGTVS